MVFAYKSLNVRGTKRNIFNVHYIRSAGILLKQNKMRIIFFVMIRDRVKSRFCGNVLGMCDFL